MTRTIDHNRRCQASGTVDLDAYRIGVTALRRHSIQEAKTLRAVCAGLLALIGALAVVILVTAGPMPAARGLASVAQTETSQVW